MHRAYNNILRTIAIPLMNVGCVDIYAYAYISLQPVAIPLMN